MKQVGLKQTTERLVDLDSDILQAVNEGDRTLHKSKSGKSEYSFNAFKCLKNKVQNHVHCAKNIFKCILKQNKDDSSSLLKSLISPAMPSKKSSTQLFLVQIPV